MPIDRAPWNALIDDDGSNTIGTVWNKDKIKTVILNPTDVALLNTHLSSTVTGAQHNWAPAVAGHTLIRWSGAADAAFTGLVAGVVGQRVTIKNTGTFVATFTHQSSSSSAGNKFRNLATSAPTPVAAGGWITYEYDGTDWLLVAHEQGEWITPPYNAADYVGVGAMVWTVQVGDAYTNRYKLVGTTLFWVFMAITTSVSGTLSFGLTRRIWGGFTSRDQQALALTAYIRDNGVKTIGYCHISNLATVINFAKIDESAYLASVNATDVYGQGFIEVL